MGDITEAYVSFNGDGGACLRQSRTPAQREVEYQLADDRIANGFWRALPPELADLVDLAMAVYLADRLVRRRLPGLDHHELGWKRRLTLELPVRLVERWRRPEIQESLRRCLEFFTEDDWKFLFVRRERENRSSERQRFLWCGDLTSPVQVALFSGGLDSLAGTGASLTGSAAGSLILVSCATNSRLQSVLETLTREAQGAAERDVRPLILPLRFQQTKAQYNTNERSQRSRGFLYGTLGAVGALMAGAVEVAFYENGIGAINLPYSPAQLGTHSTRSTNPVALSYLAEFVQLFTEQPLDFRLPYLFFTKGEMCARLTAGTLQTLIERGVSCDSFPLRSKKASQCGVCTSCLLRRQALWAAGLMEEDSGDLYFYDVVCPPTDLQDKRWHPLRDMLGQVDTFRRALACSRPWDALVGESPVLRNVAWNLEDRGLAAGASEAQAKLMSLLGRYCAEWDRFPVRPPDWRFGTLDLSTDWRLRHAC